jgi:hypothetical protein
LFSKETIPTFSAFFDGIPNSIKVEIRNKNHMHILWAPQFLDIVEKILKI